MYKDGSREGQILNKIPEQEVKDYLLTDVEIEVENHLGEEDVVCATGSCEI